MKINLQSVHFKASEQLKEFVDEKVSKLFHLDEKILNWCISKQYTVNILVNNAGYGLAGPFDHYSKKDNAALLQVNIISLIQLCQAFLPVLKAQQKAFILNIASTSAYQSVPMMNMYSSSKTFVLHFSRSLSHELKGSSVSVTAICPGPTDTDFPNKAKMKEKALELLIL